MEGSLHELPARGQEGTTEAGGLTMSENGHPIFVSRLATSANKPDVIEPKTTTNRVAAVVAIVMLACACALLIAGTGALVVLLVRAW